MKRRYDIYGHRGQGSDEGARLPVDADPHLIMLEAASSEISVVPENTQRRPDAFMYGARVILRNQLPTTPGPENFLG